MWHTAYQPVQVLADCCMVISFQSPAETNTAVHVRETPFRMVQGRPAMVAKCGAHQTLGVCDSSLDIVHHSMGCMFQPSVHG